jgi:hypothetical protein
MLFAVRHWRAPLSALLAAALVAPPARAAGLDPPGAAARDYYSDNRRGRLLIPVQVWGDVQLAGTHHVPDDTMLIDLIGLAGGPQGALKKTTIVVKRLVHTSKELSPQVTQFTGDSLLHDVSANRFALMSDDMVYVEVDKSEDKLYRNLTVASIITGLVSSLLVTYFLVKDRSK